jgi:signal-transduction protein with cAMP-binding, CBS, and nucleotidyltransferase domain
LLSGRIGVYYEGQVFEKLTRGAIFGHESKNELSYTAISCEVILYKITTKALLDHFDDTQHRI